MQLSKEAIEEYKKIYKEQFREDISDQEAYEQASNLINLFALLLECERKNKKK